ncbi:MAG: ParM/StbA family protein [Anaerolineae bacterium]|nr:ParM/StbA family protein [Anaerolineae bacterium]
MAEKEVSVDVGNGGVNAVSGAQDMYMPSVRAAATGDRLDMGGGRQLAATLFRWNGALYAAGPDVLSLNLKRAERHQGENRYGNEFHQFLTAVACARLGAGLKGKSEVALTLFAPPGMYNSAAPHMRKSFLADGGNVTLQVGDEKKARQWRYTSVDVWPEGMAALMALIYNQRGEPRWADEFGGNLLLLDGGVFTLDALVIQDGNINPEALIHSTKSGQGLRAHVLDQVLRDLKRRGGDFEAVTLDMVDAALRHPQQKLFIGNVEVEMTGIFAAYAEGYAGWIANEVLDSEFAGLKGINRLVLVGGFADMVYPHLRKWYGEKVFDRQGHDFAKKVHPAYWNSYGGLILARLMARQ